MEIFDNFATIPGMSYHRAFAYGFCVTAIIFGASALIGSYIFYYIALFIKKRDNKRYSAVKSLESHGDLYPESSYKEMNESLNSNSRRGRTPKRILVIVLIVISILASWYGFLTIAVIPSILSGLDVIPIWASIFITLIIFLMKYVRLIYTLSPNFLSKNRDQSNRSFCSRFWRRLIVTSSMYKVRFGAYLIFALGYSIAVPLITSNTCLNYFNEGYGVKFDGLGLSTKLSRYFQLDTVCEQGQICHLYSTLPEDGSTSLILNVHTGTDVTEIQIGYELTNRSTNESDCTLMENFLTAQSHYLDVGEEKGNRYLHAAYLYNLTANGTYSFAICYNNAIQKTGSFLTLPSPAMERNLTIAAGGDIGTTVTAMSLTKILSNYPLDAILIGGDIGYDNGMKSCYYSLDLLLSSFEKLNTQFSRLIPIYTSVGNHDVGFNALQGTQIDITENLYFNYFPRHSKTDSDGHLLYQIPDPSERLSYSYHIVGNTLHLALDSGYMTPYEDQVDFIQNISTQYPNLVKIANFHVPMYPTCSSPAADDQRTMTIPRTIWAPLFEQYHFASVFENHVHLYKKSFPIAGGNRTEDGKGVVYFGDGNWGISPDSCWATEGAVNGNATGLLEVFNNTRHVWIFKANKEEMIHFAVNDTNNKFDQEYKLKVNNYINYDLDL